MGITLSAYAIKEALECSQKWEFRRRGVPKTQTDAQTLGVLVHEAITEHPQDKVKGLGQFLARAGDFGYSDRDLEEHRCGEALSNFFDYWSQNLLDFTPNASFSLRQPWGHLRGVMDFFNPKTMEIVEFKTYALPKDFRMNEDVQSLLYLGVARRFQGKPYVRPSMRVISLLDAGGDRWHPSYLGALQEEEYLFDILIPNLAEKLTWRVGMKEGIYTGVCATCPWFHDCRREG